jgi:hypothetical protein
MYATPYPTPEQHPLAVLLDFRAKAARHEPLRPLRVFAAGVDVSEWLGRHAGLSFLAIGGELTFTRLELGGGGVVSELTETSKAVRQLDLKRHLQELGRIIEQGLTQTSTPPHRVYLSFGTQHADPLSGQYGIERQIFSCCDRLEREPSQSYAP